MTSDRCSLISRLVIAFVVTLLWAAVGCSSSDADESSDAECSQACGQVNQCVTEKGGSFDTVSCEAQCATELAGGGYLHQTVAEQLFEILANAGSKGTSCGELDDSTGWGFGIIATRNYQGLPGREALQRCAQFEIKLCGGDPRLTGKLCFANIYRRPEDVWAKAAPCFDKNYDDAFSPCLEYGKCRNEATGELVGQPWLGKSLTK